MNKCVQISNHLGVRMWDEVIADLRWNIDDPVSDQISAQLVIFNIYDISIKLMNRLEMQ